MWLPNFCKSCGERLGAMDRGYCPVQRCQERARADAMQARRPRILDDFEYSDAGAMPKERLLALLAEDFKSCSEGPEADLAYMTDFTLLAEKVKKHPWDDCAKFLMEREEIKRKINEAKKKSIVAIADRARAARSIPEPSPYPGYPQIVNGFTGGRIALERGAVGPGPTERERGGPETAVARPRDTRSRYPQRSRAYFTGPYDGMVPDRRDSFDRMSVPYETFEDKIRFGPAVVGPGETRIFQVSPQGYFRGSRLIVDSMIAPAFVLHDLRVGTMSQLQLSSANPIPMIMFTENAVGISLGLDTATPGILIMMIVANISGSPWTFEAALLGMAMATR